MGKTRDAGTRPKKPNRLTGARLGMRGVMATALLESGLSIPKVRQATGISQTTAVFLKKHKVIHREHVERLKKHLQDKFALVASQCLDSIDADKLKEAGVGELVRAASTAAEQAGLGTVGAREQYNLAIAKYVVAPQPRSAENAQRTVSVDPGKQE